MNNAEHIGGITNMINNHFANTGKMVERRN